MFEKLKLTNDVKIEINCKIITIILAISFPFKRPIARIIDIGIIIII